MGVVSSAARAIQSKAPSGMRFGRSTRRASGRSVSHGIANLPAAAGAGAGAVRRDDLGPVEHGRVEHEAGDGVSVRRAVGELERDGGPHRTSEKHDVPGSVPYEVLDGGFGIGGLGGAEGGAAVAYPWAFAVVAVGGDE